MSLGKKLGIAAVVVLIAIQFIKPGKNSGIEVGNQSISKVIQVPDNINVLLTNACYDCHSNTTKEQWYMNIQPLGWWIKHHIDEGKQELNFSIYATYPLSKKLHKLEEIAEVMNEDEMPLSSYTLMHEEARLKTEDREAIINWALDEYKKLSAE